MLFAHARIAWHSILSRHAYDGGQTSSAAALAFCSPPPSCRGIASQPLKFVTILFMEICMAMPRSCQPKARSPAVHNKARQSFSAVNGRINRLSAYCRFIDSFQSRCDAQCRLTRLRSLRVGRSRAAQQAAILMILPSVAVYTLLSLPIRANTPVAASASNFRDACRRRRIPAARAGQLKRHLLIETPGHHAYAHCHGALAANRPVERSFSHRFPNNKTAGR